MDHIDPGPPRVRLGCWGRVCKLIGTTPGQNSPVLDGVRSWTELEHAVEGKTSGSGHGSTPNGKKAGSPDRHLIQHRVVLHGRACDKPDREDVDRIDTRLARPGTYKVICCNHFIILSLYNLTL